MAPREPEMASDDESSESVESEESSESDGDPSTLLDQVSRTDDLEGMEKEYHTEESDISDIEEDEQQQSDSNDSISAAEAPLLPPELLKPLPSPAYSPWNDVSIPWAQMTRKQKQAERLRSRRAAKEDWDRMQRDLKRMEGQAGEHGARDAGMIAQLKREIAKVNDRRKRGRVEKTSTIEISGREKLLKERKLAVKSSRSGLKRPLEKAQKIPKR